MALRQTNPALTSLIPELHARPKVKNKLRDRLLQARKRLSYGLMRYTLVMNSSDLATSSWTDPNGVTITFTWYQGDGLELFRPFIQA